MSYGPKVKKKSKENEYEDKVDWKNEKKIQFFVHFPFHKNKC